MTYFHNRLNTNRVHGSYDMMDVSRYQIFLKLKTSTGSPPPVCMHIICLCKSVARIMTSHLSFSLVWSSVVVSLRGSQDDSSAYPTCHLSVTQTDNRPSRKAVTLLHPADIFRKIRSGCIIMPRTHIFSFRHHFPSHITEKRMSSAIWRQCSISSQGFIVAPKSFIEVLC